jgi:organic radical activating enzyme
MVPLQNEFEPKDVFSNGAKLYLYGAGTGASSYSLIALAALKSMNLRPYCFIDDNSQNYPEGFQGYEVLSPEQGITEILRDLKNCRLIISSNYFTSILSRISVLAKDSDLQAFTLSPFRQSISDEHSLGLISRGDLERKLMAHDTKAEQYLRSFVIKDEICVPFLDVQLTERCTLKCKDCSNLMQYYSKPIASDFEVLSSSLESFLDAIDLLSEARLLGGEPFLYKEINQVIDLLLGSAKVRNIIIYTNGTLIPSLDVISSMRHSDILVEITDYGKLSRKRGDLIRLLEDYDVNYVCHKPQNWTDSARIINNGLSESELKQMYSACCVNDVLTLLHGRLFHCPFSANLFNLYPGKAPADEYIDFKDLEPTNLRSHLHEFLYSKPYLAACRNCLGRDFTQKLVEPALQTSKPIELPQI